MKYKVGDKVKIRSDLIANTEYGIQKFVANMMKYCGMSFIISEITPSGSYRFKDLSYFWTDEMIVGIYKSSIKDRFIQFLRDNKCFVEYGENLKKGKYNCFDNVYKEVEPSTWIWIINWSASGNFDFWESRNTEWQSMINDLNILPDTVESNNSSNIKEVVNLKSQEEFNGFIKLFNPLSLKESLWNKDKDNTCVVISDKDKQYIGSYGSKRYMYDHGYNIVSYADWLAKNSIKEVEENSKIVVQLKTQAQFNHLLSIFNPRNIKKHIWDIHKENTYIVLSDKSMVNVGRLGSIINTVKSKIISYEEWLADNQSKQVVKESKTIDLISEEEETLGNIYKVKIVTTNLI